MTHAKVRAQKMLQTLNEKTIKNRTFWMVFTFAIFVGLRGAGYCDLAEVETVTQSTINTIFSPTLRKIALVFGAGAGAVGAYTSGSIMPVLKWGGLGLTVNYLPKIIDVINGIGAPAAQAVQAVTAG